MNIDTPPVLPKVKKPIVVIGAGGIVKDAHLPAYQKAGFEVKAIYDLDIHKSEQLVGDFGSITVCKKLEDLIEIADRFRCVYDMALPASAILPVLSRIPNNSGVLIQKPMGCRKVLSIK